MMPTSKVFRSVSQRGVTLVEMMVAMALGLLILLAVSSIYLGSRQTFRLQDDNARLQETGRYALEAMGRSVRQAGFINNGLFSFQNTPKMAFSDPAIVPVDPAITGVDGGTGADTITVQYDRTNSAPACDGSSAVGDRVQDSFDLNTANGQLQCEGQFVTKPTAPSPPGAVPYGQALVDNIEDVQILYGIDTNNDQSADQYVVAPAANSTTWNQVVSARVCVLARSANQVNNAPQRFLKCGGALGTATNASADTAASPNSAAVFRNAAAGDLRLRRTFIATFNLRNRVP